VGLEHNVSMGHDHHPDARDGGFFVPWPDAFERKE
jgi:hypothetical protein